MKIIVNDANILIDLVELNLLDAFFKLNYEFRTTELILDELITEQQDALRPYIEKEKLIVDNITEKDWDEILTIMASKPTLSEQDCSAFCHAKKNSAALITSDNTLRKFAKANNLQIYGHLWVFDILVQKELISHNTAIEKLNKLRYFINPKLGLPKNECQKRINLWNKQ